MKILVYGAFKNAEKSENYKEKVKKYLNNNEKNITYYIDIVKNNKSEKTKLFIKEKCRYYSNKEH